MTQPQQRQRHPELPAFLTLPRLTTTPAAPKPPTPIGRQILVLLHSLCIVCGITLGVTAAQMVIILSLLSSPPPAPTAPPARPQSHLAVEGY